MPKSRYQKDLQETDFYPDEDQLRIVDKLEQLHQLLATEAETDQTLSSRITGIFAKNKKPSCKGLYIWGSVGRGKTYLMDLFYDCLPSEKKITSALSPIYAGSTSPAQ